MQTGDWDESPAALAGHDRVGSLKGCADDIRCRFVHAAKSRRVTGIEVTLSGLGTFADKIHVTGCVKGQQLFVCGLARVHQANPFAESARIEFAHEGAVPVRSEGMTVGEPIARKPFAGDYRHISAHVFRAASPS
jgi:hypothetical protein